MLYVLRDKDGKITTLTDQPQPGARPAKATDPDVMRFLSLDGDDFTASDFLNESDLSTVRILEDLIDTLINRQVIRFTDLPDAAQRKLLSRKVARSLAQPTAAGEEGSGHQNGDRSNLFIQEDEQLF